MKTTVKQLAEQLNVQPVYVNGYIQTLIKMGKAKVEGKVERPEGTRGKPALIYDIEDSFIK